MEKKQSHPIIELVHNAGEFIGHVHQEILHKEQRSIEGFLAKYSAEIDAQILKEEAQGELKFVSGEAALKIVNDSEAQARFDLYYQNKNKEWLKKTISGKPLKLEWILLPEDQLRLKSSREFKITYEHP